jgi:hypothetical protein
MCAFPPLGRPIFSFSNILSHWFTSSSFTVTRAILCTNRKTTFKHVGHCQNLNWVPSLISFLVSPGFKYTTRELIQLISGSTMAEEELPSGWEKRLSRSTGVFLEHIFLLWNLYLLYRVASLWIIVFVVVNNCSDCFSLVASSGSIS